MKTQWSKIKQTITEITKQLMDKQQTSHKTRRNTTWIREEKIISQSKIPTDSNDNPWQGTLYHTLPVYQNLKSVSCTFMKKQTNEGFFFWSAKIIYIDIWRSTRGTIDTRVCK